MVLREVCFNTVTFVPILQIQPNTLFQDVNVLTCLARFETLSPIDHMQNGLSSDLIYPGTIIADLTMQV